MNAKYQHGIALVLVLWVIALLTIMATSLVMTTRTELLLVRNRIAEAELRAVSEAAMAMAALRLISPAEEDRWFPDGEPHEWVFNERAVQIRLYNEGSRIDINGTTDAILGELLKAVGMEGADAERLVNVIMDWRDPDDTARFQGAESAEYKAAGRPYGSKNAPFTSIAELRLVLGMEPQLIATIAEALTVYGNGSSVLQDYASPLVLTALGITTPEVPALTGQPRNVGGPIYRIRVSAIEGGPMQETVFRLDGGAEGRTTIIERH